MKRLRHIAGGLRALLWKKAAEEELDQELREYLEAATEQKMADGLSREEAARAARIEMGSVDAVKEQVREAGWESALAGIWQDLRYAFRTLGRSRGVTAVAVLTIAIGIAATASMYGLMRTLLLAPPPHVDAPERVFRLHQWFPDENDGSISQGTSYPFYELLSQQAESVESVAAYTGMQLPAGTGPDAGMTSAVMVSAGFWETLGVQPAVGRFIRDEEAHPASGARVAVLGHAYWRNRFGGNPEVIGQTLSIKGQPYEIVGVAPRGFRGVAYTDVDLWLPLFAMADGTTPVTWHTFGASYNLRTVIRLKRDVPFDQASAELTVLQRSFYEDTYGNAYSDPVRLEQFLDRYRRANVLLGDVTGALGDDLRPVPEARIAVWLLGVAAALLSIAVANVSGLLLLRAMQRRREIAVRLALGVGWGRLARQFATESSLIALVGGVAALLMMAWGGAWLQSAILPDMAWEPAAIANSGTLGVAALCVLGSAFLAGMAPLYYTRTGVSIMLRDGSLRGPGRRPRLQGALLAVQGALSVVLLVGAGLFLRSLHNVENLDIGFDRDVLAVQIDFTGEGRTNADVGAFFEEALRQVSAIPGVVQGSLVLEPPLRSARSGRSVRLPGTDVLLTTASGALPYENAVSHGFFATMGMRLREGRDFIEEERSRGGVIIVNETMAQMLFPGGSAVGECVFLQRETACRTIAGVVADSRVFRVIGEGVYPYYYLPMPPGGSGRTLLVRMSPEAGRMDNAIRMALHDLDSGLPYIRIETLGEALNPQIRPWRLGASVFTAFGLLAMILAMVGLWSSVAYAVSQRTREFAIRMAVGATGGSLVSLTLKEGIHHALIAVAAGLAIAAMASRFIADLLFQVSPYDALVFAGVATVIFAVAILSSLLPALRAARIDPAEALRTD